MRLSKQQIKIIKENTALVFGDNSKIYLFGSRADDDKKGGDIDLYLETIANDNIFEKKIKLLALLQKNMGERKIDLVINNFKIEKLIYAVARETGIQL